MVKVGLDRPWPGAAFRFQSKLRGWVELASEGQIRKSLLRYIGMFMPLIWAYRVQRSNSEHSDDATENICLFEVQVYEISSPLLHELDRLADMNQL